MKAMSRHICRWVYLRFMEVVRIFPGEWWIVLGAPEGWILSRVSIRSSGSSWELDKCTRVLSAGVLGGLRECIWKVLESYGSMV